MYKLFIVEDDPVIAQSVKAQAELWDLDVRLAEDFHAVMDEFTAFLPHIVLLDISLPFSTAIIGAVRSAKHPTYPSSSSPPPGTT